MRNRRLIFAFILSTLLSLLAGLLSDLSATYLAPSLADQPWLVYGALIVTFAITLPVSSYLFLHGLPPETGEVPAETTRLSTVTTQPPIPEMISPSRPASQLPGKSYRELVGRDARLGEMMAALRDPAGKWIVAVDGIGGIGKTALARESAERCLTEHLFDMVVWERASNEEEIRKGNIPMTFETALDAIGRKLGAPDVTHLKGAEKEARVRALLRKQRVLVVLDNLETAREPQNDIARQLRALLGPSKALLTSRHRFQGEFYTIHLSGLDEDGALSFTRQEAKEKGIHQVAAADPSELKQIFRATGGSPLALKLVVGQLDYLPLDKVLDQLSDVRAPEGKADEDDYFHFYRFIFLPSWRLLSDSGKNLLISMAIFAPGVGGTPEAIKEISGLADNVLTKKIDELWRLSFLEVDKSPSLTQVRYYLHQLTQYFVLSDILKVLE
jgi:hypothetical protein